MNCLTPPAYSPPVLISPQYREQCEFNTDIILTLLGHDVDKVEKALTKLKEKNNHFAATDGRMSLMEMTMKLMQLKDALAESLDTSVPFSM